MYEFHWEWCDICEKWTVICPKCGIGCNREHGFQTQEICDVCNLAYQYQDLAYKTNSQPDVSKETLKMIDHSMENFKKGIVSNPIDLEKI